MGIAEINNSGNNLSAQSKPRLLIVEDDYENQKFLELYLKRYFQVNVCDSSDTFYDYLHTVTFDIILMDISIKGDKNGLELTKELKNDENHAHIPVICYTAHAFNTDRINALDAGCDAYLSKPSDIRTLLGSLYQLLKATKKDLMLSHFPNLSYTNA